MDIQTALKIFEENAQIELYNSEWDEVRKGLEAVLDAAAEEAAEDAAGEDI